MGVVKTVATMVTTAVGANAALANQIVSPVSAGAFVKNAKVDI